MWRALFLLLLAFSRPALAAPALWAVHGPHATVYLLGSIHLMRPDAPWESPAIDRAFDEAQECWFELEMSGADNVVGVGVLLLTAFDFSHRLSDRLSPKAWGRLTERMGLQPWRLDHVRPWLVATILGTRLWMQAGFTAEAGVERVLSRKAKAAGKKIRGVETSGSQIRLLANMPDTDALAAIEQLVTTSDASTALINRLTTLWLEGDVDAAGEEMAAVMRSSNSEFTTRLVTDRNIVFADAVSRLLAGDKTVLLTVGAFHMIGAGGVPALLKQRGWTVDRVD